MSKIHPQATSRSLDMIAAFFFFLRNNFPLKMPVIEEVNVPEYAHYASPGSLQTPWFCDPSLSISVFSDLLLEHRNSCWGAPNALDLAVPEDLHAWFWRSTFLETRNRTLDIEWRTGVERIFFMWLFQKRANLAKEARWNLPLRSVQSQGWSEMDLCCSVSRWQLFRACIIFFLSCWDWGFPLISWIREIRPQVVGLSLSCCSWQPVTFV